MVRGGEVPESGHGFAVVRSVMSIAGRMNGAMAAIAAEHGMTLPHLEVLLCLRGGEGISQSDLSERMLITKGNVCVIVQKLEGAGLVDRRPDPTDQRLHRLYLTPDAQRLLARTRSARDAAIARPFARLTAAERKTLYELLGRVEDALDDGQTTD